MNIVQDQPFSLSYGPDKWFNHENLLYAVVSVPVLGIPTVEINRQACIPLMTRSINLKSVLAATYREQRRAIPPQD
jgi:hypothetical protein